MNTVVPALPEDLAENRRREVEQLLAEVELVHHREHRYDRQRKVKTRCWKCGKTGRMGGHHLADGTIVLVHPRCHRRIHGKGRLDVKCSA